MPEGRHFPKGENPSNNRNILHVVVMSGEIAELPNYGDAGMCFGLPDDIMA